MDVATADSGLVGPQVIFGMDATGRCTMSVGAGLHGLGLEQSELVGVNLWEAYSNPEFHDNFRRVLGGETFTIEQQLDGRTLSTFWQPIQEADGSISGAIGVTTDVTEQRRADAAAAADRERTAVMSDLSNALAMEVLDVPSVLQVIIRSATFLLADFGAIWVRTPDERLLEPRGAWHENEDVRAMIHQMAEETRRPNGWVDVATVEDITGPRPFTWEEIQSLGMVDGTIMEGVVALSGPQMGMRLPLRARGRLIGLIDLARTVDRGVFTERELAQAEDLAKRSALALENALLLGEQREALAELVKFKALADASQDLIAITDPEGHAAYVNPRVTDLGLDADGGAGGKLLWETVADLAGEATGNAMREALETGRRWTGEVTTEQAHGVIVRGEVFPLLHPDSGASLGVAWIGQDVTDLRSSEAALRAANADLMQFRALVDASPDFIAIAGLDGKVRYVNPAGRALIDLDPDTDITQTTIVDYLTPEGIEASLRIEQPAVIAHGHWEGQSTLRHSSGRSIPVTIVSFMMTDLDTGAPIALVTVQRDISERLAAEAAVRELGQQREALLERLVQAQEAERAQIAADVHDDSVQALAAVDLRLGLLARKLTEQAPELLDYLRPLQANVMGATERLRSLLFDLEPPDMERGLSDALLRAATQIFGETRTRVKLTGDGEPEVPEATAVVAYRIAREAMINAYKHASAALVTVDVAETDGGLEVTITDDGVGLRTPGTSSPSGHYGLSSMRDRAAVSGGRCEIRPGPDGGTQVTLWMPIAGLVA